MINVPNNKQFLFSVFFSLFISCSFAQMKSDCGASPYPVIISQPDGSSLSILGVGNELNPYTETIDGYSIAMNTNGYYVYLNKDTNSVNNSGQLVLTPFIAHNPEMRHNDEKIYLTSVPVHLRNLYGHAEPIDQSASKTGLKGFSPLSPLTGKNKILMLLIQYPDLKATYTKAAFDSLMNTPNYGGTGSFHDYYMENSFGKLNLTINVAGWYMAPAGYKTYSTTDDNGARALVDIAVDSAHAQGIDFSQYDNDGNGYVDAIIVVHAGPGAEEGGQTQYIWSHHWVLAGAYQRFYNGVHIYNYTIQPEIRLTNGPRITGIGVFCHEYGHVLGLPDYYNTEAVPNSNGVGEWEVMGSGNWLNNEHTPASFSAYSRTLFTWLTPRTITLGGYYTLKPAAIDTLVYKINTQDKNEYYLLENKQRKNFDAKLDGTGLIIWHVNDSLMSALIGINRVDTNINAEALAVVQADGKFDLEKMVNRGDAGDPFPGSLKNKNFNDSTIPSAKLITGRNTGISVLNITQNLDSTVTFGFGSPPVAAFSVANNPICQYDSIQFVNTSLYATQYLWDFGDTTTDTVFMPKHVYKHSGNYNVKLKVTNTVTKNSNTDSSFVSINKKAMANFVVHINGPNIRINNLAYNYQSLTWQFGDGSKTYLRDTVITYSYKAIGNYIITLVAVSSADCADTFRQNIDVKSLMGISSENSSLERFTAYPNPFTNSVNIRFGLDMQQKVDIALLSILGRQIAPLSSQNLAPGSYDFDYPLDHLNLASGVYIIELRIDDKPYYVREIKK